MPNKEPLKTNSLAITDLTALLEEAARSTWPVHDEHPERPPSYRLALGKETIHLGIVEFRVLLFLASRPYHAFTTRSIAAAVSSEQHPVTDEAVDRHISSLVEQLGVFHDYVQSVPYIGYRFKP